MSIAWPARQSLEAYRAISLATAVAIRRAVSAVVDGERLSIKWPNDLLIDGQKVAGILCEHCPSESSQFGLVVIGIGINVDFDLALLPSDLRHPATTLSHALGRAVPVDAIIDEVAQQMTDCLERFEARGLDDELIEELRCSLAYVGTMQRWQLPQDEILGHVVGIDDAGRLLLEVAGNVQSHEVGEFAPIRA